MFFEYRKVSQLVGLLFIAMALLVGCGTVEQVNSVSANLENVVENAEEVDAFGDSHLSEDSDAMEEEIVSLSYEELLAGTIQLTKDELVDYGSVQDCSFQMDTQQIHYELQLEELPKSDDPSIYLFAYECYEDDDIFAGKNIVGYADKTNDWKLDVEYDRKYLFSEFIPAIFLEGEYVPIAKSTILLNPEILAPNQSEYPQITSKKGLLIDPTTIGTEELASLGVKHAVYNIPISLIMGESDYEKYPTIEYEYDGETYLFNGNQVHAYDSLFTYFQQEGMCTTAIILNDWNDEHEELIHPQARSKRKSAHYYAFNTAEEVGVKELEAVALFLAERYSNEAYGMVHNWVIANEINEHTTWNYMDTEDIDYYAREFEKGFRIFYQAIRSRYSNARVYFSIDNQWNEANHTNRKFFNGKELLTTLNDIIVEKGNYDWCLAIHPYLEPMTRVKFWDKKYDKSEDAEVVTIMNLGSLTQVMEKDSFRNREGNVRDITITELGFSSKKGEKLQTTAFLYCYLILENNPYISAFLMNRQTDSPVEMRDGLAFGIYKPNGTPKYLKDAFTYIDTDQRSEYLKFMLDEIGATSLAEAVTWAN